MNTCTILEANSKTAFGMKIGAIVGAVEVKLWSSGGGSSCTAMELSGGSPSPAKSFSFLYTLHGGHNGCGFYPSSSSTSFASLQEASVIFPLYSVDHHQGMFSVYCCHCHVWRTRLEHCTSSCRKRYSKYLVLSF